ncbi:DUF2935 domain-containing protein [Ureibacillus endophyticus]|uniref:DUF2935 domain-containing protein n=1 Tax=Ureibacillus endophyticus TaxID=1978490 RepID=A0A494Z9S6_9BACL|nr:DUF2935 domain-containing protein [Lysinibacillus endophyticus]RKQ19339.1 DUF2935 domain-containing protein [Lysinibacillus endophyticus]
MSDYLRSAVFEHSFWLHVLSDHSRFIYDSLYPSEKDDISKAVYFIKNFDQLRRQVDSQNESTIENFTRDVEKLVAELKQFKLSLIKRHLLGQMNIHLSPTFMNHMVNELEEYQLILSYLKVKKVPPIFHELHHHLVWLVDAAGHAGAINDQLDGVEKKLKEKSHEFTKQFEQFYLKAVELTGYLRSNVKRFPALKKFNHDVEVEMGLFKTFLNELKEMELSAEILGTFTASMADHMAREEQYYLTKLMQSSNAKAK